MKSAALLFLLGATLGACSSTPKNTPVYLGVSGDRGPMKLIEGPVVKPPANDISEAKRMEWLDAQRPKAEPVEYEPVRWREREPVRYERDDPPCWLWAIPLSLSFGYSSGGHCNGGWGVGATWGLNGGWW